VLLFVFIGGNTLFTGGVEVSGNIGNCICIGLLFFIPAKIRLAYLLIPLFLFYPYLNLSIIPSQAFGNYLSIKNKGAIHR
jgi:hypothetical protein